MQYDGRTSRAYGASLRDTNVFYSDTEACSHGEVWIRDGFAVIVRPAALSTDGEFYEWRSLDGKRFVRTSFGFPFGKKREPTETELCG